MLTTRPLHPSEFHQRLIKLAEIVLVLLIAVGILLSKPAIAKDASITAFVDVNVVPMDREQVLENHTVVVVGDRIVKVGPMGGIAIPDGAEVIDGRGNYLIPGLADMHVHLNIDANPDFMRLFLAQGVTTIRNLNALPDHLVWRDQVLNGELIGPRIYTSGPVIVGPPEATIIWAFRVLVISGLLALGATLWSLLWLLQRLRGSMDDARPLRRAVLPGTLLLIVSGGVLLGTKAIPINTYTSLQYPFAYIPDTEERARAEVRRQVGAGYDLIKVYDWLTRSQYLGAIDEARIQGIYVIAHLDHGIEGPFATGLRESAHVDEFLDEHLVGEMSPRNFQPMPMNMDLIPQSVASVANYDGMVVSNMATDVITYEFLEEGSGYFDRAEYAHIRPEKVREWLGSRMVNWQGQQDWRRNTLQPFLFVMTKALHDADVPLLIGTDVGIDGMLPVHIHRELELLVEAGLTPYEALSTATRNAALSVKRMGRRDVFGKVASGHRADLVLLRRNPLENISYTRKRIGVMARGNWYTQDDLEAMISVVIASY